LRACRARFSLAQTIVECLGAEPLTNLTVFARLERFAIRSPANRVGSAHPNAVRDRHVVRPAHRSPDAAPHREADSASDASSHATGDREARTHHIAGEHVDPAWLTDE
jgi:hypothetical protein